MTSISAGEKDRPKEFCDAVKKRTGRMPKNGWVKGALYFCIEFSSSLPDSGFKRQAIMTNMNPQCQEEVVRNGLR